MSTSMSYDVQLRLLRAPTLCLFVRSIRLVDLAIVIVVRVP